MKIIISYMLIIFIGHNLYAQLDDNEDILKIRKQFQYIVQHKSEFKIETEEYDWERDELLPSLTEEEMEHEYNEQGNHIAYKKTYKNLNNEIQLIEIDERTDYYQLNGVRNRKRSYYFHGNELFFYFEQTSESSLVENPEGTAFEIRIYIKDDQIIRWLRKESSGNLSLDKIPNSSITPSTGYLHDYDLLDSYNILSPDW